MKSIQELAVFGGAPTFAEALHVGRPNIGETHRLYKRIEGALAARWLTNDGPYVREFERRVSDLLNVRHCIATSSGTMALQLAAAARGLSGEVIIPSFTFVATAHALQWLGLTPVFCDVDSATHLIDPRRIEPLITERTSAIVGVHLWGRSCDVKSLEEVAHRHGLALLFDAAHAFGCSSEGQMIGNFGQAEAFSFHATKVCNTFEGGAVTTNDDGLAEAIRRGRNFGFDDAAEVASVGTNGKMNEASAAMGLTSLESLDMFMAHNLKNYQKYHALLAGIPGLRLGAYSSRDRHNYHYIVVTLDEAASGLTRDDLQRVLQAEGVLARSYFSPGCHQMEPYRSPRARAQAPLPVTEQLTRRVLCLPTGTAVGDAEIARICEIIRFCVASSREIAVRLAKQHPEC